MKSGKRSRRMAKQGRGGCKGSGAAEPHRQRNVPESGLRSLASSFVTTGGRPGQAGMGGQKERLDHAGPKIPRARS